MTARRCATEARHHLAEARKLDAAITRNLKELGYGG